MSKNKKLVVSLFCGIGGLDLGFESAGFEIAIAIDNNPKVLELYRLNFPDTLVLCRDIGEISTSEIRETIKQKYPDWDGEIAAVIGGPPCQGFSAAGKQNLDDDRSQLVLKFINLVVELNPLMFVMENVPAIEWQKFSGITGNAIASQVLVHLQEHQTSSMGASCFVLTHVLDLQTVELLVDLRIFCSIGQQLGEVNYLGFGSVGEEISKVGNERCLRQAASRLRLQ
jgi:site-specific DNA-cytosine methylase